MASCIAMTSAWKTLQWSGRRNETFMSSSGENSPPPVWELSLEPSGYMLTAFSSWCGRLSQSVRVGMKILYLLSKLTIGGTQSALCGTDVWFARILE